MQRNMLRSAVYGALLTGLTAALGACGGGSSSNLASPTPMSGTMPLTISDALLSEGLDLLEAAFVDVSGAAMAATG